MKVIHGDLLKSDVPAIIHQCNCFNTMGAGIAKLLSNFYPEVSAADNKTHYGDKSKLGTITYAEITGDKPLKYVINVYGQYFYGRKGLNTDYDALRDGLDEAMYLLRLKGIKRVGIPYLIGCGLAGGSINKVTSILEHIQKINPDIEIELYKLNK